MPTNNALLDLVAPSISVSTDHLVRHACLSNSFFELIVFPTEQCNFRCTYCYEDFAIGNMKPAIINRICRLLERRTPTLDKLKISYFGGEPLLNMRAIREISGAAIRLEAEHGFEFVSNATTNAYLLDASHLEELVSLKCNAFQISLDGWADVHDQTRQRRNGSGSFERLWSNLLAIHKTDLSFMVILRVHMTPENAHSLVKLVENINKFLDDDRFLIVFKKVGNWGGTNKDHPDTFDRNPAAALALHQKLLDTAKRVYDFGIDETGGNAAPSDTAKVVNNTTRLGLPPICYAAKANSLAIRANGRINKCTVALKSTANDIGSIDENGDLQIDAAKLAPWLGGVSTMDGDLLRCPASRVAF